MKMGPGSLVLSSPNLYIGQTIISAGTLELSITRAFHDLGNNVGPGDVFTDGGDYVPPTCPANSPSLPEPLPLIRVSGRLRPTGLKSRSVECRGGICSCSREKRPRGEPAPVRSDRFGRVRTRRADTESGGGSGSDGEFAGQVGGT